MSIRKPPSNVIEFQPKADSPNPQPPAPQMAVRVAKKPAQAINRRSFLQMFLLGSGIRHVASFHRVKESACEEILRQELALGGVYARNGISPLERRVWQRRAA